MGQGGRDTPQQRGHWEGLARSPLPAQEPPSKWGNSKVGKVFYTKLADHALIWDSQQFSR